VACKLAVHGVQQVELLALRLGRERIDVARGDGGSNSPCSASRRPLIVATSTVARRASAAGSFSSKARWRVVTMSSKAPRLSDQVARFFAIASSAR
jgi:hypothetical protein